MIDVLDIAQSFLIFPGAYVHRGWDAKVRPAAGLEILDLKTADAQHVGGIFGRALHPDGTPRDDSAKRPTVLFFYGNGDCVKQLTDLFQILRRMGFNVLIPEYIGYPMSGGKPSEAGIYATADASYEHLLDRADVDPRQIVAAGQSLGAAAAIDLASRRPVSGLATFSAFTTMTEMARKVVPILPTRLMLRHFFDNEQKIAAVTCPILLVHGTEDGLVPFSMMARLAAKARGPVTIQEIAGANHNDLFLVGGAELLLAFSRFVESLACP